MHMHMHIHMHIHMLQIIQAEAVPKPGTFADVCAHSSAKHITVRGHTGPANAVEADGALFIQNEAEAGAIRSKALDAASEVVTAPKAATTAAASEVVAPALAPEPAVATAALDSEPSCAATSPAVIKFNSYAAAVSKPPVGLKFSTALSKLPVGPKFSAAASQLSADLKRPSTASKPAAAVLTPLEVNM